MERLKDYLLMEEEFVQNQKSIVTTDAKEEVCLVFKHCHESSFLHQALLEASI
jgi:hypothetical protein